MLAYFVVIAVFFMLYFVIPRKQSWIPFLFITIALAVIAYYAEPNPTDDLVQYFKRIDAMRDGGLDYFQAMLKNNEFDFGIFPVAGYYCYFISLFPNNQFLPFFTILICYGCISLIMLKAAKRFQVNKFYFAIASFFLFSTFWYYDVYSGTRNGIASIVAVTCAYYHFVEKKNVLLCFIGYALSCGMHATGALIIALVLIAYFTQNNKSKFINVLLLFAFAGFSVLLSWVSEVTDNAYIQTLAGKSDAAAGGLVFSLETNFLVNVATLAVAIIIAAYAFVYIRTYITDKGERRFFRFAEVLIYFSIGAVFSGLIFIRLLRWCVPIVFSVVYMVGMQIQKNRLEQGLISLNYDSDTPHPEKIRAMNKGVTTFFVFAYSAIHFWYDFAGSSLMWLHF